MEAVAMSVVSKPVDLKKEYLKALGRLVTCLHGTMGRVPPRLLSRLQITLAGVESVRATLDPKTLEDAQFLERVRSSLGLDAGVVAAFVHTLARLGHFDEAERTIAQLALFDPPMHRIIEAAAMAPRTPQEAKDAFVDAAEDLDLPLRVRLAALWWLVTVFHATELGEGLLLSLIAGALREGHWQNGKLVLGMARALLQRKAQEPWSYRQESPPNFLHEYDAIATEFDLRDDDACERIPF